MRLASCFIALPLLLTPMAHAAAAISECAALQTEVETLRAKLRAYESTPVAVQPVDTQLPGVAAKPAALQKMVIEEPYSRSGCSQGLFKGITPAIWQDSSLWLDLAKGQTPAAVEALLGVEHYDERGGSNVIWHFGKCGAASQAQVLFTNGKLANWRAPSR